MDIQPRGATAAMSPRMSLRTEEPQLPPRVCAYLDTQSHGRCGGSNTGRLV